MSRTLKLLIILLALTIQLALQKLYGVEQYWISWLKVLNCLNEYATLLSAIFVLFTALVALYLGSWREKLRRPKLKLDFTENKEDPYIRKLSFGEFDKEIQINGQITPILRPGLNVRVKVYNDGKSIARKAQARIEKIDIYKGKSKIETIHYHPTAVKWSGEPDYNPVDIVPGSHYLLDLFFVINETSYEILSFNYNMIKKYGLAMDKFFLESFIEEEIKPSEDVYWGVWIDTRFKRGIPEKYRFSGVIIIIFFIINAENCGPLRFEAIIHWSFKDWDKPKIQIRQGNKIYSHDVKKGGNLWRKYFARNVEPKWKG